MAFFSAYVMDSASTALTTSTCTAVGHLEAFFKLLDPSVSLKPVHLKVNIPMMQSLKTSILFC